MEKPVGLSSEIFSDVWQYHPRSKTDFQYQVVLYDDVNIGIVSWRINNFIRMQHLQYSTGGNPVGLSMLKEVL